MNTSDSLGPLPKRSRNSELEQLAISALRNTLPHDTFLIRDERIEDYGVDFSLELIYESKATNFQAQAQLKSIDSSRKNSDGSISIPIKTANLNYLLNGISPIYFLYIVPCNEVRYSWAHDERKQLENENPNWKDQETITIRFRNILDPKSAKEIYQKIFSEARLHKTINEKLQYAISGQSVLSKIDSTSLLQKDMEETKIILEKDGFSLVAFGKGKEVLEVIKRVEINFGEEPYLNLVASYAHYSLAQYYAAIAQISKANLKRTNLSTDDQNFLDFLKNICKYQLGQITLEEYEEQEKSLEQTEDGWFLMASRLEKLRGKFIFETNDVKQQSIGSEIQAIVEKIKKNQSFKEPFKLQAELVSSQIQAFWLTREFGDALSEITIKVRISYPVDYNRIQEAAQKLSELYAKLEDNMSQAEKIGNPFLEAEARSICIKTYLFWAIWYQNMPLKEFTLPILPPLRDVQSLIGKVTALYSKVGNQEGELRAKLDLATLLELEGKFDEATRTVTEEVLPVANAMEYKDIVRQGKQIAEGKSAMQKLVRGESADPDESAACMTDEQITQLANQTITMLSMPSNRLNTVRRALECLKDAACERLHWCENLEIHENLNHIKSPGVLYSKDPERRCFCLKHKYQSAISSSDWKAVLSAFKKICCETCPDRKPKSAPS